MKRVKQLTAKGNMKILIFLLLLACLKLAVSAQETTANKPNTIYIEGLGIGMRYSINYERQFQIKESNWGFSLSGGIAPNFSEPKYLWFPLRIDANYQIKNSRIGAGVNYMFGYYWFHSFIHPEDIIRSTSGFFLPGINYEYQFENKFVGSIRILFVDNTKDYKYSYLARLPFLDLELYNKKFVMWPGLAIGYSF